MKKALFLFLFLLYSGSACGLNDCQTFVLQNWPQYNFTAWAVACMENCSIQTASIEDANAVGEAWLNEQVI